MAWLQAALFFAGLILLIVGYRRDQRKILLGAAIVVCVSGLGWEIVIGFTHGLAQTITNWARI